PAELRRVVVPAPGGPRPRRVTLAAICLPRQTPTTWDILEAPSFPPRRYRQSSRPGFPSARTLAGSWHSPPRVPAGPRRVLSDLSRLAYLLARTVVRSLRSERLSRRRRPEGRE